MTKKICFDMDGTIADLYGVDGWLDMLRAEDATPYEIADPLCDMVALNKVLIDLIFDGYEVSVISWAAMDASAEYNKAVRKAKREWLKKNLPVISEIHVVKYGTPKQKLGKGILVDDNADVRKAWKGETIDPTCEDIVEKLESLLAAARK